MKKIFVCLLLVICINYIYPECMALEDGTTINKDTCLKRKVGNSETSLATGHTPDTCCHMESSYKLNGNKVTTSICSAFEKKKVGDYIKKMKEETKKSEDTSVSGQKITDAKFSLDCSSSYLKFGIMALFIILF